MRRLLVFCVLGVLASAQDDDAQRNTALVRLYPHLDRLVTKAEALAKDGRYREALDLYIEAMRDHPNHLVPVASPDGAIPRAPTHYRGVQDHCLAVIAGWPEEGKAAYRAYYDPFARDEYEAARAIQDLDALRRLAERYPFSSLADDALALLGSLAIDEGLPSRAAEALERLLAIPDSDVPRAVTVARLAAVYAKAGRIDALTALAARARDVAGQRICLGDRESTVAEHLNRLLRTAQPVPPPFVDAGPWECLQGDGAGARPAEPTPMGNRAWTAPLPGVDFQGEEDDFGYQPQRARASQGYRPIHPVVSDGIVYAHNEYQVWAFNLFASNPELLWQFRTPAPPGDLMFEERLAHTTSVHDGRVFATLITGLGRMETRMQYIHVKFPFPKRALFALDAYTGKELWRLGGQKDAGDSVDGFSFPTAPTPHEGHLYVGGIKQKTNTDPFNHFVLCVEAATGRVVWQTFVAGGGTEINLFGNSTRESVGGAVAVAGDDLYYCTNHGAIAALDRRTGRLRWLYRYEQLPVNPTRSVQIRRNPLEWCNGAPVVAQDTAVFAPTDSRKMFALATRTGQLAWERGRGDLRHLYGASGTVLVAGGDALEWYDLARGGKLLGRFEPERGTGAGRGVVAVDGAYFPTTEGLYRVPLSGPAKREFSRWPGGRDGGNVVAAEGALVLAGATWIDALFDRRDREAEIAAALAKSPDSAPLVYRSALRLLQSGKEDQASELLAKVIDLVARSTRASDERLERAARRRLFGVSMEAGRRALDAGNVARARHHFGRARDVAAEAAGVVEAAKGLVAAHRRAKEFEAAIQEMQKLIAEHGEELAEGRRVAEHAKIAIAAVVAEAGPGAYAAFEAEAREKLEQARRDGTAEAHLAVWRRWPNSAAAELAILGAADAYERVGRPEESAGALRLFLREYPGSARAVEAQKRLVESLEKRKLWRSAAGVLRKLARSAPDPETRRWCEEHLAREEYRMASGGAVPSALKPPVKLAGAFVERDQPNGMFVLRPEGPPIVRAASLLFVYAPGTLKGVRAETGEVAWKLAMDAPPRVAYAHEDSLIVCTEKSVSRIHPLTGGLEWRWSSPTPMRDFCLAESAVCATSTDARNELANVVTAIDAGRGTTIWSQGYAGMALPGGLVAAGERVALVTAAPNRLHAFDVENGRRELEQPLFSSGAAMRVLGAHEGLVVVHVERNSVEAYDLAGGKLKWKREIRRFDSADVRLSRGGVFILGRDEMKFAAATVDAGNGKLLAIAELSGLDDFQQVLVDESRAYIVSRPPGRPGVTVRALSLDELAVKWTTDVDCAYRKVACRLAADHVVLFAVDRLQNGKFDFAASVLDKGGRVVQNIKGDGSYEQAGFDLSNDAILILVDNRVEVHR